MKKYLATKGNIDTQSILPSPCIQEANSYRAPVSKAALSQPPFVKPEYTQPSSIDIDRKKIAYPVDTSHTLNTLIQQHNQSGEPQSVSFRELVPWIKVGERGTHYLHPYPAKLLPQIAHFFLAASSLSRPNDLVLDPFGGTGTVALEALLSGRSTLYADANPLARLITATKTRLLNFEHAQDAFGRVSSRFKRLRHQCPPDVVNLSLWYTESTIRTLARLRSAIEAEVNSPTKDFLWVTFSTVARRASLADPRFSVPVRLKQLSTQANQSDVWTLFRDQFSSNFRRQKHLQSLCTDLPCAACVGSDARSLKDPKSLGFSDPPEPLPSGSVGLVITSPPYAGAQKYIRASSLSLGWLGLARADELRNLEAVSIGREHFPRSQTLMLEKIGISAADEIISRVHAKNKMRATIISSYLKEMRQSIREISRVLCAGGHVVLVIGDNEVCGEAFESHKYLENMFIDCGFKTNLILVDMIKSRGLMTKRNKTAGVITREWILLLEKKG